MNDHQQEVEKLYAKFESETFEKITTSKASYKLYESGQPRNFIKNILTSITTIASMRLDAEYQTQLYLRIATDLFGFDEYSLALECYHLILQNYENIRDELLATKTLVEAMQNIVKSNYAEIVQLKTAYIAPMVVSKLLVCLQELRTSLDHIFNLPTKQQESLAWIVLNTCKLIVQIGQPLVWYSCGKYVIETMMFSVISMEAVINLCTVRHMKFRMKIYSTMFYAALANGVTDQAYAILEHARKQANQLKEREELDPPVPPASINCIQRFTIDLAVMKFVLDYWKDPDSFNLSDGHLSKYYTSPPQSNVEAWTKRSFADLCASECIRVHLLTAGNTNEVFRKRSTAIAKGITLELKDFTSVISIDETTTTSVTSSSETSDKIKIILLQKFSMRFLLEAMILFSFYSLDGIETTSNLCKLASLGEDLYSQYKESNDIDDYSYKCLKLLLSTHQLSICKSKGNIRIQLVTDFILQIQMMIYAESAYRSTSFLKKVVLEIWMKHLYPTIQESLSDLRNTIGESEVSLKLLKEISPGLLNVVKVFDVANLEDPILMGAIALLCSQVLAELGDFRGCLSLVHQAISTINEHRAARIDILQHIPEDVRDIQALQRGSFTTRSDYTDWFHSIKRLGAHAFAGYGIFGLASSADRGDQAMSEIHSELVAFYIRKELDYSIQQVNKKNYVRKRLEREEEMKTAHAKALLLGTVKKANKKGSEKSKSTIATEKFATGGLLTSKTTAGTMTVAPTNQSINVQSLPVIASLKSFCAKNAYYRCILLLEMARYDSDRDKKIEFLAEAYTAVEECEGKEQMLKEAFVDLLVMTETNRNYPLVVARSHHYIYVAPVGFRKLKKAVYYKILAKEKGSGTGISIHNDDLGGCEKRIYPDQLNNLKSSIVRIGPLHEGEQYVLGSAAYTDTDKVVGGVSPTSPVVDAVNPLPTILLWNWLTQLAQQIGYHPLHSDIALRVTNRYFMKTPKIETRVIGHGLNLFIFNEPSLCMLALQQSSPVLINSLIDSCVSYETLYQELNVKHSQDHVEVHWFRQCPFQFSGLTTLHRTALVSVIACGMQNHDLTLRCVKLGCDVAFEMIRFDIVHLSQYLQNPLIVLILSLQNIPKRNWNLLEHKLYTKLFSHLVKIANMNRNITPVITVLNVFYPEVLETDLDLANSSRPPSEYINDYTALLITVQDSFAPEHLVTFLKQFEKLFIPLTLEKYSEMQSADTNNSNKVGYLWSMPLIQRRLQVTNCGLTLLKPPEEKASTDRLQLEKWIILEKPLHMSDYLNILVQLSKEVSKNAPAISANSTIGIFQLLERLPICKDYLASRVSELSDAWQMDLLQPIENYAKSLIAKKQILSPRIPVKGGKPPAGATPEPDEATILSEASMIPERYSRFELEEERSQLKSLGELLFLLATNSYIGGGKITNHFPKSIDGPNVYIDPNTFNLAKKSESSEESSNLNIANISEINITIPLSSAGYIKLLGCALDMLRESESPYAATQVACAIWRFIVCEWIDPASFCTEYSNIKKYIIMILKSIVSLIESMSYATEREEIEIDSNVNDQSSIKNKTPEIIISEDSTWSYQREVKENSLIIRNLIVFFLKVEWIQGENLFDVVQLGSRVFKTMLTNSFEYIKTYGDHTLPLIMNAQEKLIDEAKAFVVMKQSELENFICQYEEAQKKKRTKKLRIARLEKTEEELLYEAEKSIYEQKVNDSKLALEICYQQMINIKTQQKRFECLYSSGSLALDKLRLQVRNFIVEVKNKYGLNTNYMNLLNSNTELYESFQKLIQQFAPIVSVLRLKKEKVLLVEALKLQGDLLLFFQLTIQAKSIWNDAVDGLFNVMDACSDWKIVSDNAITSLEIELLPGILPIIVIIGKLSRFCASNDLDAKANYARMAANLCRIPFQESFGHPQTIVGFAAYECLEVGGVFSLSLRSEALSSLDLALGLQEIISTLISEKQYIIAMPVVVLLEHIYAVYISNASLWFSARLMRIRILIESHLFAEAASMIASIRFMISNIHNHSYADVLRMKFSEHNKDLSIFNSSENGLNFYGNAPYFNNLPPDDAKINLLAIQWIALYGGEFETFAKSFRIALPIIPLTPEELIAEAERKKKAEEEAALAAKKAKGGKGASKTEVQQVDTNDNDKSSQPLFSIYQISELHLTIGRFLIETSMLDNRSTTDQAKALQKISNQGLDSLKHSQTLLYTLCDSKLLRNEENMNAEDLLIKEISMVKNKDWLRLYASIEILKNYHHIHTRKYKQVRVSCMNLISLLKNEQFNTGLCGDTRNIVAQLWFSTRSLMIIIADCQARFNDVLDLTKQSIEESSMLLCGYWLRNYLYHRSRAQYKLGNLSDALRDIQACINQYEQNKLEDLQLTRCLCLKASIIRETTLYSSKTKSIQAYIDSIALIRKSVIIANNLAKLSGAYPCDANVTYHRSDTAIKQHHMISPILQSLTELHENEPDLSLKPKFDKKKLQIHLGITFPSLINNNDKPSDEEKNQEYENNTLSYKLDHLRLSPLDRTEGKYSETEYVNINLMENRVLLTCQSLLCQVIDDARNAGLTTNYEFSKHYTTEALVNEQLTIGEQSAKLIRHCVYLPIDIRVTTLLFQAKARIAKRSKFEGKPEEFLMTLIGPLTAALEIVINAHATHLWPLLRAVCVELVELYGDQELDLGEQVASSRLKIAVVYLLSAINISNQYAMITKNCIGIGSDASFDLNPSEELSHLITNLSSSSATPDIDELRRKALEEASAPAIVTGKGAKAPPPKGKGAPSTATSELVPNGRDALYLLSTLIREQDPLWLGSTEQFLCGDIHSLLRSSYPIYKSKCSLEQIPDSNAAIDVVQGSISTLWKPHKMPDTFHNILEKQPNEMDYNNTGFYSHLSVFFLLGDALSNNPSTTTSSNSIEPILTKIVLPRPDVVYIEKLLRNIRDRILDAEMKGNLAIVESNRHEFGKAMCIFIGLLKQGVIIDDKLNINIKKDKENPTNEIEKDSFEIIESKGTTPNTIIYTLNLFIHIEGKTDAIKTSMSITPQSMLNLANLCCYERDTLLLKDNEICRLVRSALGYKVPNN